MKCKKCDSKELHETEMEVLNLDHTDYILVDGSLCTSCGCFHFELDNYTIYEFFCREHMDKSAETIGKYVTDYDRKLKEKHGTTL